MGNRKYDRRRTGKQHEYYLRCSPDVIDAMAAWAADELRSTGAQIEVVLREALRVANRPLRKRRKRG